MFTGVAVELIIGGVAVLAVVGLILWLKDKQTDEALDQALIAIHAEARSKLAPEDIVRLTEQLKELAAITHRSAANGIPAKQASRMGKRAAIQTIASAIEIDRMFGGTSRRTEAA